MGTQLNHSVATMTWFVQVGVSSWFDFCYWWLNCSRTSMSVDAWKKVRWI